MLKPKTKITGKHRNDNACQGDWQNEILFSDFSIFPETSRWLLAVVPTCTMASYTKLQNEIIIYIHYLLDCYKKFDIRFRRWHIYAERNQIHMYVNICNAQYNKIYSFYWILNDKIFMTNTIPYIKIMVTAAILGIKPTSQVFSKFT